MPVEAPSYLTTAAAAELLAVSQDKIQDWIASRQLVAVNVAASRNGRPRWRIAQAALDQFLAARSTTPPPPKPPRSRAAARPKDWVKYY